MAYTYGLLSLHLLGFKDLEPLRRGLYAIGLGLGQLAAIVFSLGQLTLLYPGIFLLLFGLSGCIIIYRAAFFYSSLRYQEIPARIPTRTAWLSWLLVFFISLLIVMNIAGALSPEMRQDSLQYHVSVPHYYLMYHQMMDIPYNIYHYYSLNQEMLYTFTMAFGTTSSAKLLHAVMGILTFLGIFVLARKSHPLPAALLAGFLFYCQPQMSWMSSTAFNENGWMFFGILAIISWMQWKESLQTKDLFLSGIFCGLGISIKLIAIIYAPFLLSLFTLVILIRHRYTRQVIPYLVFLGLLLLPVTPWLIRNYIYTHNPFFPMLSNVFTSFQDYSYPGNQFHGIRQMASLNLSGLLTKYQTVFSGIMVNGNWMLLLFLICIPMGIYARKELPADIKFYGGYGVLCWFIYTTVEGGLDGRFIYPVYPIMGVFCGSILWIMLNQLSRLKPVLIGLVTLSLFSLSIFGRLGYAQDLNEPIFPVMSPSHIHQSLSPLPIYTTYQYVNSTLPQTSNLLVPMAYCGVYCDRKYIGNSEFDLSPLSQVMTGQPAENIYARLREWKITHVVIPSYLLSVTSPAPEIRTFEKRYTKRLLQTPGFYLIEIQSY